MLKNIAKRQTKPVVLIIDQKVWILLELCNKHTRFTQVRATSNLQIPIRSITFVTLDNGTEFSSHLRQAQSVRSHFWINATFIFSTRN